MKTKRVIGIFWDDKSSREGFEVLTQRWLASAHAPAHTMSSIGTVVFDAGHRDVDKLFALYHELKATLPTNKNIKISHDHFQIRMERKDWDRFEILAARMNWAVDLEPCLTEFFEITKPCQHCDYKTVRQIAPLRLDSSKIKLDFCQAMCGWENSLARMVSRHGRAFLESLNASVHFSDIIDARSGQVSSELFQLHVDVQQPVSLSSHYLIEGKCSVCGRQQSFYFIDNLPVGVTDEDVRVDRPRFRSARIARTGISVGHHRHVSGEDDSLVITQEFSQAYKKYRPRLNGIFVLPAYIVPENFTGNWGGLMHFGKKKIKGGDWQKLFDARLAALEARFGKADDNILHSAIPLHLGGYADVATFQHYVPGVAYMTNGLIGATDQKPNALGAYELMMCTREPTPWAADLISRLARYTFDTPLNPGETIDIGPAVPAGATIQALLFTSPELTPGPAPEPLDVLGVKAGVLLAIGITAAELAACRKKGSEPVLEKLKASGVFPYTDLNR